MGVTLMHNSFARTASKFLRRGRELHPRITVLQTVALLLGYHAKNFKTAADPLFSKILKIRNSPIGCLAVISSLSH
jgi:hypothetical protein